MTNLSISRAAWPFIAIIAFVAPFLHGGATAFNTAALIAIFAVMAYGLDLIVSDLGEMSLAHTVFFAAGSYTTALLSIKTGASAWITLAATIAVALVLALVIGLVTLRLREFVFSLVTYALTVVAMSIASNWDVLGGSDGLRGIPLLDLSMAGVKLVAHNDRELWPYAFALIVAVVYLVDRFRHSRLGAAAIMVHLNPRLARMSGINPAMVRLQVFLFSAPISASAGWLYAYQRAYVSADVLESYFLILMLTAVVLFGSRQLLGPLVAMALLIVQKNFFSLGGDIDKIVLGAILTAILAFFPQGLAHLYKPLAALVGARRPSAPTTPTIQEERK